MSVEVLTLRSEGCLDVARVGAKAAGLAAATRRGIPVPAGAVIPVEVSAEVLDAAAHQAEVRGVHAARLAMMESDVPDLAGLSRRLGWLGADLAVRSSSPLEAGSDYAGAFTSYLGVTPSELATAVRGVWASALLERAREDDRAPAGREAVRPRMAVLVQPQVHPRCSGTAQVCGEVVTVIVVRGSPAPLLAGWSRGERALAGPDGEVTGEAAVTLAGQPMLSAAAALARRARDELGADLIEWAGTDRGPVLLQARTAAPAPPISSDGVLVPVPPAASAVARLVHAFAGSLGEEMVLPVVLAGVGPASEIPDLPRSGPVTRGLAAAAWSEAQVLSRSMRLSLWGAWDRDGAGASSLLANLRGGSLAGAVDQATALPAADPAEVAALLGRLGTVAAWLELSAMLSSADQLWAVPADEVDGVISGTPAENASHRREARRRAVLRWEPFVYTAICGTGRSVDGEGASGGVGAGRAVVVLGLPTDVPQVPRMVVVAPNPIPQLAPLLWGAAGLVTTGGATAAHLIEVARSRGVPAVIGCNQETLFSLLEGAGSASPLIAVDGDRGRVVVDRPGLG